MIEKLPYILIAISILILLILFVDVSTNKLIIKEYTIENKKVYKGVSQYEGIKIVFFSDLHTITIQYNSFLELYIKNLLS